MPIYDKFASIYQRGPYTQFSQKLAESVLPEYLISLGFVPGKILDVACGEGSFAVEMAKQGYQVTGIDQSQSMIDLAALRAGQADVEVNFQVEDMRELSYTTNFDLVTCLFDSMNYLLTIKDLNAAILGAFNALKLGGLYIFDMNTIYGLAVDWMRAQTYIQNQTDNFIEIHQQEFDYENSIATMRITIFQKQGELWERIEETHHERGYPIADVRFLLEQAGFEVVAIYGSLSKQTEPQTTSPRAWFVARKPVQDHL